MARKLGETLIEEGLLDPRRLQEALRSQRIFGGSLGSNLLQLGFIDEETLGRVLGRVYGVPVATRADLRGASAEVIALLPIEFTRRHRALPFRVEGHRLHLALQNPADSLAIHEAAFLTGFQVVPHVAAESVLRDALMDHQRDEAPSSRPRPSTMTGAFQVMPPAGGAHDTGPMRIVTSPTKSAPSRTTAPTPKRPVDSAAARPTQPAPKTPQAPPRQPESAPPPRVAPPPAAQSASAPRSSTLAQLGRALANARTRDEILAALLDEMARLTPRSIVFLVKGNEAIAASSRGIDMGARRLALPLDQPSVLDALRQESTMSFGPIALTPANQDFYTVLGGRAPRVALVLPVFVRKRPVLALYGDDPNGTALPPDFGRARRLAALAGWSLEALVLRSKILRESGAEAGDDPA